MWCRYSQLLKILVSLPHYYVWHLELESRGLHAQHWPFAWFVLDTVWAWHWAGPAYRSIERCRGPMPAQVRSQPSRRSHSLLAILVLKPTPQCFQNIGFKKGGSFYFLKPHVHVRLLVCCDSMPTCCREDNNFLAKVREVAEVCWMPDIDSSTDKGHPLGPWSR